MIEPVARTSPQHGQIVPLMAAVMMLVAVLALGAATLGARVVDRARAQNAADAAALAAAVQPDGSAAERIADDIARRNGAELLNLRRVGTIAVVDVRLRGEKATAAARPVGDTDVPTGETSAGP